MEKKNFTLKQKGSGNIKTVEATRAGKEWMCLCPWHNDTKPSLSINEEKKVFFCHGCHASGRIVGDSEEDSNIEAIYDYFDKDGKLKFQVVRKKGKEFPVRRPDSKGDWIWNLKGVKKILYNLPEVLKKENKQIIILEGEKDCETLKKLGYTVTCNPFGAGKWDKEYSEDLRGKDIVIIADNDEDKKGKDKDKGLKHAIDICEKSLGKADSVKLIKKLPYGKDVTEFFEVGGTPEELKELISTAPVYQKDTKDECKEDKESSIEEIIENLKEKYGSNKLELITEIRKLRELQTFEERRIISSIVIEDLKVKGVFYITVDNNSYYFEECTKKLSLIEGFEFIRYIANNYGINKSEYEFRYLIEEIITETYYRGRKTEIHRFAYYDVKIKNLYIFNSNNEIYKLDGNSITILNNGTDGILFLQDQMYEPFNYIPDVEEGYIQKLIINRINFVPGNLTKEENRLLFHIWIFFIFFESRHPTKPILLFTGPKGSGKTSILRSLGIWLFGKNFDVSSLAREKEDAFVSTISNNYLVCYDNVDGAISWLNDRLATSSTGQIIQMRKLYTTNETVTFRPKCFIALTSRSPKFKRDDVVDRLLIFKTERFNKFISEETLLKEILEKRNELWSELLKDLNIIISELKRDDNSSFVSSFRLADFANFGYIVVRKLGREDEFKRILEEIGKEQSRFLLEDDPIMQALYHWLEVNGNIGRSVFTSILFNELKEISENQQIPFKYNSVISFGKRMKNIKMNIEDCLGIEISISKERSNATSFIFKKSEISNG